ncbi:Hypothetical_protein [Hexamita inflata]|uniref:Hypothetical_protein n=1 Tax=Hexamita inflata TaxID=28002 RepID=A0AA86QEI3_9EUKA|nr:Hypothetical protein HINF_LOCUS42417 [Hexamita inflata]
MKKNPSYMRISVVLQKINENKQYNCIEQHASKLEVEQSTHILVGMVARHSKRTEMQLTLARFFVVVCEHFIGVKYLPAVIFEGKMHFTLQRLKNYKWRVSDGVVRFVVRVVVSVPFYYSILLFHS